ncbi:MAG: hypothetical protein ABEH59_12340 [Halobacteriales archaeon]
MDAAGSPADAPDRFGRLASLITALRIPLIATVALAVIAVEPALAQSTGGLGFCETQMAETVKNVFTLIQFGGPLIGGVIALGATVVLPSIPRTDRKKRLKEARNQAVVWGVLVAPLGTAIIGFLLNNVVAGGASCGF